jgi:hypothetical protein
MISKEEAKKRVSEYVNAEYNEEDDELIIVEDETITKDYGWIFFSVSKKYLETQNISDMVVGLGGILFEKESGSIIPFGSGLSIEEHLEAYEKRNLR